MNFVIYPKNVKRVVINANVKINVMFVRKHGINVNVKNSPIMMFNIHVVVFVKNFTLNVNVLVVHITINVVKHVWISKMNVPNATHQLLMMKFACVQLFKDILKIMKLMENL